jgi:hypothetical protein
MGAGTGSTITSSSIRIAYGWHTDALRYGAPVQDCRARIRSRRTAVCVRGFAGPEGGGCGGGRPEESQSPSVAPPPVRQKLIRDYELLIEELLAGLSSANHDTAVTLAALPERIRGFGHVKLAAIDATAREQVELLEKFRASRPTPLADAA